MSQFSLPLFNGGFRILLTFLQISLFASTFAQSAFCDSLLATSFRVAFAMHYALELIVTSEYFSVEL